MITARYGPKSQTNKQIKTYKENISETGSPTAESQAEEDVEIPGLMWKHPLIAGGSPKIAFSLQCGFRRVEGPQVGAPYRLSERTVLPRVPYLELGDAGLTSAGRLAATAVTGSPRKSLFKCLWELPPARLQPGSLFN